MNPCQPHFYLRNEMHLSELLTRLLAIPLRLATPVHLEKDNNSLPVFLFFWTGDDAKGRGQTGLSLHRPSWRDLGKVSTLNLRSLLRSLNL